MNDEAMVIRPSVSMVQWIPEIIPSGPGRCSPPRYRAARSEDMATPKLIDICWTVLEMLLPGLASASERSANTSVFTQLYCNEEAKPRLNPRMTISHAEDPCATVMKRIVTIPMAAVFTSRTRLYPNRARIRGIIILRLMAARGCGAMRRPDCTAV